MFMSLLAAIFDRYRACATLNRHENKARWRLPSSAPENNGVQFFFYHWPDWADLQARRGILLAPGNQAVLIVEPRPLSPNGLIR